jgi:hypothetical protein
MADIEQLPEGCPQVRRKLGPSVGGDDSWYSKRAIQLENRAMAQSAVVMEERGIASGHLDVL